MPKRPTLVEARPTLVAEATGTPGRYRIKLIDAGQGTSGFYSPDVLAEAATNKVFVAGLKMYADHPRADGSGIDELGNRSVTDVWGKLVTDATVNDAGALVAEAQVRPDIAGVVDFLSDAIGLSIRGLGTFETGEVDGKSTRIVTSIDEALSVDFVVDAGRGGQILGLVESARAAMLGEATANDVRDALGTAVDEMHGGEEIYTWVRDYDPDKGLVYFEVSGNVEPRGTYSQAYTLADDGSATLTGAREEVTARTEYVPVSPAGSTTTTESEEDTMPQIEEARLRQLEADAGRVQVLEAERDTAVRERDEARGGNTERDRRDAARPVIAEAFNGTTLSVGKVARLTESLLLSVPASDDGTLDGTAMTEAATTVRTAEEGDLAEALAAHGVGKPSGFGGAAATGEPITEADYNKRLGRVFQIGA